MSIRLTGGIRLVSPDGSTRNLLPLPSRSITAIKSGRVWRAVGARTAESALTDYSGVLAFESGSGCDPATALVSCEGGGGGQSWSESWQDTLPDGSVATTDVSGPIGGIATTGTTRTGPYQFAFSETYVTDTNGVSVLNRVDLWAWQNGQLVAQAFIDATGEIQYAVVDQMRGALGALLGFFAPSVLHAQGCADAAGKFVLATATVAATIGGATAGGAGLVFLGTALGAWYYQLKEWDACRKG